MIFHGPVLVPITRSPEIVRLNEVSRGIFRIKWIQASLTFLRIAIRGETHSFAFAVAMDPAEGFGDVAVKPPERAICGEFLERRNAAVFAFPHADGPAVSCAVTGYDESFFPTGQSTGVIRACGVRQVVFDVNNTGEPRKAVFLYVKRRHVQSAATVSSISVGRPCR